MTYQRFVQNKISSADQWKSGVFSMGNSYKSASLEQIQAEETMFPIIERMLNARLEKNRKIYLADNAYTYIQPDFYSESDLIIGEIFAHIGKPKKAQDNKISNDILKMLLLEKVSGKNYRKIIAVCDETEMKKLKGLSALAESIRQFHIEVLYVRIDESLKNKLLDAQCRQKMVNV